MDLLYRDALSCSEWGVAKGSSFSHKLEHLCLAHGLFVWCRFVSLFGGG